ncbi:MAG: Crp/Fnr family transcriptional regulator [Treponema sp.]|jgi:CRP/FNR family transcriptional regulator|nr:Crp/Fnr family transcriptional regulator [Treponema sp.]
MDGARFLLKKGEIESFPITRLLCLPHRGGLFDDLGIVKSIPKNTVFIKQGDFLKDCYVLRKGCVVGFEYTLEGDERIYDVNLPYSLILEACVLLNKPSPVYFKAIKSSELVCIDRNTLVERMKENFHITMAIIESLTYKFYGAMEQIRETKIYDVTWRFCNLLLIFAVNCGIPYDNKTLIKEKVSQQMLSNMLGVNRVTINRISQKLKDMALIEQINGHYCIHDIEKLKRHMEYLGPGK